MIIFVKLFLAHILGDFLLQPNSWVADKEQQKTQKHLSLYSHCNSRTFSLYHCR